MGIVSLYNASSAIFDFLSEKYERNRHGISMERSVDRESEAIAIAKERVNKGREKGEMTDDNSRRNTRWRDVPGSSCPSSCEMDCRRLYNPIAYHQLYACRTVCGEDQDFL